MRPNNFILIIAVGIVGSIMLSSCSSNRHVRDLQQFLATLEAKASSTPKTVAPQYSQPTPVTFEPNIERSPFEAQAEVVQKSTSGDALMHPLQTYALSGLKFKGTVIQGDVWYAFLLAPDDKLYQVKLGDVIGNHYGKIIHIYPDHLDIQEKISDRANQTTTRIVTLQRKD